MAVSTNPQPVFFHVDLDAFFASVEQRENPELIGKPVIIGRVGPRMVVSTCSYEARKYGVHSAMPTLKAQRLCPNGIFIDGHYELYSKVSSQVMAILKDYAPVVHQVSIDEAWLDMTGTELLFGKPKPLAMMIKERVKKELKITMSIGIAASPFIAKMASDYNKPDGLCMVSPGKEEMFIDAIGLSKIWGIGKSSLEALKAKNITTPKQIRELEPERLQKLFGPSMSNFIYKAVRGMDPVDRGAETKSRSISSEQTFFTDITDESSLHQVLLRMSHELMYRSLEEKTVARTIGLKLRWGDFRTVSVQTTAENEVLNQSLIYETAKKLLASRWKEGQGIRLIGLGLYQVYSGENPIQTGLFDQDSRKKRDLDKTIHELENKGHKLKKASELL